MNPQRPLACVIGDMDLVRPLALAGIRCAVVAPPGAASRYSRFTQVVLPWADPWERGEELVEILVRFGAAQPEPPVLFYQQDRDLLLVSRHRERLAQVFRFVIPDATLVEELVDKARFQELAQRVGLPVPPARVLHPNRGLTADELDLRFPIVVKPLLRRTAHWEPVGGLGKAIRVDTAAALAKLLPRLRAAGMPLIAQELVPGPETRIESYHVYVDRQGVPVGEFAGQKIRTNPAEYGHSTALRITNSGDVIALGRVLAARLGLRGVAKFDFKRDPRGELHLLEINPRFTLWNHPGALAGVNLPALVYRDLVGLPREAAARRSGVRWCKLWEDWGAARAAGVSLVRWLPWAMGCEAKRIIAWDDPLPFVCATLWELRHRVRSVQLSVAAMVPLTMMSA